MSNLHKLVVLSGPLLLIILTAIAGYAYATIRSLSLPIPQVLALFAVVLPLIAGVSTQTVTSLSRSRAKGQNKITISLIAVIGFQLIYETIIATLAITYIAPPSALDCGLQTRWKALWKAEDADAIRAIQDAFQCCGFRNTNSMAYPFGSPSNCAEIFGRTRSCYGPWRRSEQVNAGLILLVALSVFTVKVLSLVSIFTNTWAHPRWARIFHRHSINGEAEEDHRATTRRLIEEGNGTAEEYHDEPTESPASRVLEFPRSANGEYDEGPRVEPSPLNDSDNAWRNQEEGHTA